MTTTTERLIPLGELREVLANLMRDRAYMAMEPTITREGDSWVQHELPPDQGLRLDHFLNAIAPLPDPCPESMVAGALIGVFRERGLPFLTAEFIAAFEARWPGPDKAAPDTGKQDTGEWMPLCGWCGKPCNDQRAKWCSRSHRQQAYKKRKRDSRPANGRGDDRPSRSVTTSP